MYDVVNVFEAAKVIAKSGNIIRRIYGKRNNNKNNNSNTNINLNINTDTSIKI